MNSVDWAEVGAHFADLVEQPADLRAARLADLSRENPALAEELRVLLASHDCAEGFFEEKVPRLFASLATEAPFDFQPGSRLLHFEILKFLGEGSCARVYLARDTDLDRQVALKISMNQSREARTLAHVQLEGIVQVYSEHLVDHGGMKLRVICLQYITGPTLSDLIEKIEGAHASFTGALDACEPGEVPFDPTAFKWRDLLQKSSLTEAIVLTGMRLAEILSQTHARGILHLDLKPANILIDPYGRPFLSDFNVSMSTAALNSKGTWNLGGTPRYMPPEQAKLFVDGADLSGAELDARTDVFALGVVLKDLLAKAKCENSSLHAILTRATHANQIERTGSAKRFARELRDWMRAHLTEKEMLHHWKPFGWICSHPVATVLGLTVASQLGASVINISYNQLQIVSKLTPEQNSVFMDAVALYNLLVYPTLLLLSALACRAFYRAPVEAASARRTAVRVPWILALVISVGWLPGAWLFPRWIDGFAGPIDSNIYWQFAASIWLGWLISMTTSLTLVLLVLARVMYPKYWTGENELAARELRGCERLNRTMTLAAALLPMSAVLIMMLLTPANSSAADFHSLKVLLLVTTGLSLLNLVLVQRVTQKTDSIFTALKRARSF